MRKLLPSRVLTCCFNRSSNNKISYCTPDRIVKYMSTTPALLRRQTNSQFQSTLVGNSCQNSFRIINANNGYQRNKHSTETSTTTNNNTVEKKAKKRANVTTLSLASNKRRGRKITMVTAYDFPSAIHVARANIDILLVGDSCAMVELGYETTQPMDLDQMLHHCQAVKRGVNSVGGGKPLLVGDMPLGTYEYDDTDIALRNVYRMVKEGGMDAIKLEV